MRIVFCDRIVGRAFREKIPVKQSFFHILTELLPLILFTLRPGSCDDLILVTDAEKFSAGFCGSFRKLLCTGGDFSDRGVFFQDDFSVSIRKDFQRFGFPYFQSPPDLLGNNYPSKVIDTTNDSCSFHICSFLLFVYWSEAFLVL